MWLRISFTEVSDLKTYLKTGGSFLAFLLVMAMLLSGLGNRMSRPDFVSNYYTAGSVFDGMYGLQKDTLDVLFLGSSHGYNSYDPQHLYDVYRLRSYNLSTSRQGPIASYYWLKEVLKTQSPRAVVFEVCFLFHDTDEPSLRIALNPMHLSGNKLDAIRDLSAQDPELYDPLSFLFPLIRYHERWKEPSAAFFQKKIAGGQNWLKGFFPGFHVFNEAEDYVPFDQASMEKIPDAGTEVPDEFRLRYLDKMADLCREEGIALILSSSPSTQWSAEQHNYMADYASARGLSFYDFNCREIYDALNYDINTENLDKGHPNVYGAAKITSFFGKLLTGEYGLTGTDDAQWVKSKPYVDMVYEDFAVFNAHTLADYLMTARKDRYTIFLTIDSEYQASPESMAELEKAGVRWAPGQSVCACIDYPSGTVLQEETLLEGTYNRGLFKYSLSLEDPRASIILNRRQKVTNDKHLHICVFDNVFGNLVDSSSY